MITGKQRSYLKGLAQRLDPTVTIGKFGLTDAVVDAIDDYISVHELVKVNILDTTEIKPKEVANQIADRLGAEFVQAIGKRFVLYRMATEKENRMIVLPKK